MAERLLPNSLEQRRERLARAVVRRNITQGHIPLMGYKAIMNAIADQVPALEKEIQGGQTRLSLMVKEVEIELKKQGIFPKV
jgi:hypothetical protein